MNSEKKKRLEELVDEIREIKDDLDTLTTDAELLKHRLSIVQDELVSELDL